MQQLFLFLKHSVYKGRSGSLVNPLQIFYTLGKTP